MGDDLTLRPPRDRRDRRDDAGRAALEEELRVLFAPIAAPHGFRERLKADLLHGNERLVLVAPVGAGEQPPPRTMWRRIEIVATHPRTTLVASALAVAAVIVLALLLNADRFDLHTARSTLPLAGTRTPRPTRTAIRRPR